MLLVAGIALQQLRASLPPESARAIVERFADPLFVSFGEDGSSLGLYQ
jgi:hypothetical protein